ncbi:MAG TPA: dihydrodipicolinate synthase family protein [Geminicoccaceae bacterium]|nr:dihydrodipicolinate synthase family protein [Geminicoccaceae bacterium]
MGLHRDDLPEAIRARLRAGGVIPAHPLALDSARRLDPRRQRALSRYYIDAGAIGLAVGVHSTQFAIREVGLYEPVLRTAAETAAEWAGEPPVLVAGLCGRTRQAVREAQTAVGLGYHAGLLSLAALGGASEDELIGHCAAVAREIPLFGFYLQPAVGGIDLSPAFWRRFAAIDNVVGIKIAPFDRYRTLAVVRGVAEAGAEDRIALYTGNDDHILLDLLTPYRIHRDGEWVTLRMVGGLLGHWGVWTGTAVGLHRRARRAASEGSIDSELLALDAAVTDMNGAIFDPANGFAGCLPGIHEVLRRQGLLEGTWCLDPHETLSPGQREEIDRVTAAYPELTDDAFVELNLARWLA